MTSLRNRTPQTEQDRLNQLGRYLFIAGTAVSAVAVTASIYFGLALRDGVFFGYTFIFLMCQALYTLGWYVMGRGRTNLSIFISLFGFSLGMLSIPFYVANVGLLFGIVYFVCVWQIGLLGLNQDWQWASVTMAIIGGLAIVFLETFGSENRVSLGAFSVIANVFSVTILIGIGILIWPNFRFYTLRTKLVTAVTLATILSLTIAAVVVSSIVNNILTETVGTELSNIAANRAATAGEVLARQVQTLDTLRLNAILANRVERSNALLENLNRREIIERLQEQEAAWDDLDPNSAEIRAIVYNSASEELNAFRTQFPNNAELLLTNQYGAVLASTSISRDFYYGDDSWWLDAFNGGLGQPSLGVPAYQPEVGVYAIPIALPLYNQQGEFSGVLRSTYLISELLSIFREDDTVPGGAIELVIGDQILRANQSGDFRLEPLNFEGEFLSNLVFEEYFFDMFNGAPSIISISRINTVAAVPIVEELRWSVLVAQTEEAALEPVRAQQRVQILLGLAVVFFSGFAASIVARWITEPILELSAVSERVSAGDLEARAEVNTGDEIQQLARTFNTMTAQVQESLTTLEARVAERTQALEASLYVSRSISRIIEREELLKVAVQQLRDAFDYYHVHVYLYDETADLLRLAGGSGDIGRQLLERGHILTIGTGMVGRAALAQTAVLAPDVRQNEDWTPNELLPDTKSELAVPIVLGDELMGVIDVQDDTVNRLNDQDAQLLQTIANQMAVALRNADFYENARRQVQRESLINDIRTKIQQTNDISTALKTTARELSSALRSEETAVLIRDPNQENKGNQNGS